MSPPRLMLLLSLLLLSGCLWPVREKTDQVVHDLASRPYDLAPPLPANSSEITPAAEESAAPAKEDKPAALAEPETDVQTVAFMQAERPAKGLPQYELKIPSGVPGSEAPPVDFFQRDKEGKILRDKQGKPIPLSKEDRDRYIKLLYPELPPLPEAPTPQPGPHGQPYTLADLQKLAAEYSPVLRQVASDVGAAKGNLIQVKTYQNPVVAYNPSPNNNNSNTGARGGYIDQHLTMWGKRALAVAAAEKAVDNAELALKRARTDLATNVRNAYFALIVAKETVRVNQALARFTDEIYRLYTGYLASGLAASFEPAALRSQAYTIRLTYQQAIYSYIAAWNQLVATIGLHHLPLTEVQGRVDRLIPYYDYDKVLAHVLAHHTDVLTARNGVQIAQYNLKLAQITPYPDMDVMAGYWKEMTVAPFASYYMVTLGFPIPIWDQNRGNIIAAQAALVRAVEESHRVENYWTNTLAAAFANYQNNLKALEYYRRSILPNQVIYYRGVFDRRYTVTTPSDLSDVTAELVTAQQALTANVQAYLGILGSLWSAVVSVADPLQSDNLFQLAERHELPELPDLDQLPRWLCPHGRLPAAPVGPPACRCPPASPGPSGAVAPTLPAPRRMDTLPAPSGAVTLPASQQPAAPVRVTAPAASGGSPQGSASPGPEQLPTPLTRQLLEPPPEVHLPTQSAPNAAQPQKEAVQ